MNSFVIVFFLTFLALCGTAAFINFSKLRGVKKQQQGKESQCSSGGTCLCRSKAVQQTIKPIS